MEEIIPNLYQLTIKRVNIYLIVEDKLTLIDTGFRGSAKRIEGFIRSLGRSPKEIDLIILTHHHPDHIGSLPELKEITQARVAIHEADLLPDEQQPTIKLIKKLLLFPPLSPLKPALSPQLGEVEIKLQGGEVFEVLGGLEVIPTPGHTPGSISLWAPKKKLLFVGDAINNRYSALRPPPKSVSSNQQQAIKSIESLIKLDFSILLCGHGKVVREGAKDKVRQLLQAQTNLTKKRL